MFSDFFNLFGGTVKTIISTFENELPLLCTASFNREVNHIGVNISWLWNCLAFLKNIKWCHGIWDLYDNYPYLISVYYRRGPMTASIFVRKVQFTKLQGNCLVFTRFFFWFFGIKRLQVKYFPLMSIFYFQVRPLTLIKK